VKRSILVEKEGGPLAAIVAPANRHDTKLLEATLEAIVIDRPVPTEGDPQHLCLGKGYDNPTGHAGVEAFGYIGHIRPIGEEPIAPEERTYRPRRWVVEACLSWLNRWRGLLVRYEKKVSNYLGVMQLACGLLWYRRLWNLKAVLEATKTEF
jgi:putative transposase